MKLLCFAHKKEAWAFFQKDTYILSPDFKGELYRGADDFILITGEGVLSTLFAVTQALSTLINADINEVLNFGVVGALDSRKKLGEIYSIRTVYAQGEFASFTSFDEGAKTDVISSRERLADAQEAQKLLPFAPLVDRELWALAYACKQFKRPFAALKIVSDFADSGHSCQVIKEKAQEYSQALFCHWKNHPLIHARAQNPALPLPHHFYFTTSMERLYQNLLPRLGQFWQKSPADILQMAGLSQIEEKPWTPKQKAQELLQNLKKLHTAASVEAP